MRLSVTITVPAGRDPGIGAGVALLDRVTAAVAALEAAGVTAVVVTPDRTPGVPPPAVEPTTLAGALARRTSSIGVVAADSALFGYPYNTARRLATLDHLTRGRAGWSVEAHPGPGEEAAFGVPLGDAVEQAARAEEYVEVVTRLWNSWEPGAVVPDKVRGDFRDDTRIHPVVHRAAHFRLRGALDVPRSPQGRPVIVWPVRTALDVLCAARHADVVVPWCPLRPTSRPPSVRSATPPRPRAGTRGSWSCCRRWPGVRCPAPSTPAGDPAAWAGAVRDLVRGSGADGATLVTDGTFDGLDEIASELVPALRAAGAPPERRGRRSRRGSLTARLGLAGLRQPARRPVAGEAS
ncbi:hypothetical protein BJF78_28880 [Pseudonocardia sp. CNS-139]|nr:hypothetical protein BJF78_28880 [Pseudonocardia sp. CNS-139]